MPFRYPSPLDRLISNSIIRDECWVWTGPRNNSGYGKISQRVNGLVKSLLVHRYAYTLLKRKEIPNGYEISHTCGTALCWRPDHLVAESHGDNLRRRGRYC
jgi:hypothetical protein